MLFCHDFTVSKVPERLYAKADAIFLATEQFI